MKLSNSLVVITGGTSGLGAATALRFLVNGAHVAVIDLQLPQSDANSQNSRIRYFKADITSEEHVGHIVAGVRSWAESAHLRIAAIICCAGILGPAKILSKSNRPVALDRLRKVVDVSLIGTIDVVRQFLPIMTAQSPDENGARGVIVTVSSAAAFDGQEGQVGYSAAKGAIASMTLPLARDLSSRGIRAVCIAPGIFETGMASAMPEEANQSLQRTLEFPARAGQPDEFALLVEHVIANDMLNGTVIRIDGASRMPSRL